MVFNIFHNWVKLSKGKVPLLLFLFVCTSQFYGQKSFGDSLYAVEKKETFVYAEKNGIDLYGDVYEPKNTFKNRPVFIFMHGGGFKKYSPREEEIIKLSKVVASYGYVAVPISYRLTRKGKSFDCDFSAQGKLNTFKMAAEDLFEATQYLIDHKDKFGIDPSKIIIGGSSAGAEAVLCAAYNRNLLFENPSTYKKIKFSGVLSLAGAIPDSRYINSVNAIPAVFFHGTDDDLVPYEIAPHHFCQPEDSGYLILDGAKTIADKLKTLNVPYMLNSFPGAKHEICAVHFNQLDKVFKFFDAVVFNRQHIQQENTYPQR